MRHTRTKGGATPTHWEKSLWACGWLHRGAAAAENVLLDMRRPRALKQKSARFSSSGFYRNAHKRETATGWGGEMHHEFLRLISRNRVLLRALTQTYNTHELRRWKLLQTALIYLVTAANTTRYYIEEERWCYQDFAIADKEISQESRGIQKCFLFCVISILQVLIERLNIFVYLFLKTNRQLW